MTANHQMVSKTTLESYEQSDPPARCFPRRSLSWKSLNAQYYPDSLQISEKQQQIIRQLADLPQTLY
jgi:hypothetical protein